MENRIKVLIADGSEAFCGHLKNELQQLDGYDLVGTAADGEEAVRLLEATKPDILVLDLMLAKRDGISVLRYANAMDKPPVGLVTSGFITDYVAMTVSNLGVQYLMMKPCDMAVGGDPRQPDCHAPRPDAPSGPAGAQHRVYGHRHHS